MAGNSDFEWNDWSEFLNEDADDTPADQANGIEMQGATGPIDPFSNPRLDQPYFGHPDTVYDFSSTTPVPSNDTFGCFSPAPIGLPADIVNGCTASLGDPGLLNTGHGIDQAKIRLGNAQPNDSNDMAEALFLIEAHVNTEARSTTSSALRSVPGGKPAEANDKITVADIDRLYGTSHIRFCTCLNCLTNPPSPFSQETLDRFPALQYISCRIEGCTWNQDINQPLIFDPSRYTASHEKSHFRESTLDQDGKLIYTCTNERCRIRTKRKDDVKRHYATVHCKNPQRFPCHVIDCPFGGENGFTRKDKLTSHMKSTHKGLPFPGKRLQAIKPKTGVSNAGVQKAGSQA